MNAWGSIPNRENHIVCSPSALICFRESPELYKLRYIDKEKEETSSMEFGTMVHMRILQPEKFFAEYAMMPEKTEENDFDTDYLKATCKELGEKVTGTKRELAERIRAHIPEFVIYEELVDEIAKQGKKMIPHAMLNKINTINDKIMSHPKVGKWIELSEKEKKGYWTHPSGVVMPFLADAFFEYNGAAVIIDLKITVNWDNRRFSNSNYTEGRGIQAASYCKAISAITGKEYNNFLFIAIEPNSPNRIRYYQADRGMLDAGEIELDHYINEFKERYLANDFGPRKSDMEIQETSLASWDWDKINNIEVENV